MTARTLAQTFAQRLPGTATVGALSRMAASPSYLAPRACDVLNPLPFVPPAAPVLNPELESLLKAVIANPSEDMPRLNAAYWYERNGDGERARFICRQLAGLETTPNPAWAAVFAPWSARHIVYRRGFVEAMSLAGRAFLTLGAPLFQMTPLREVRLVAIAPYLDELATCPHLKHLTLLDLRGNRIHAEQCDSFRSEHLFILCDGESNGL